MGGWKEGEEGDRERGKMGVGGGVRRDGREGKVRARREKGRGG